VTVQAVRLAPYKYSYLLTYSLSDRLLKHLLQLVSQYGLTSHSTHNRSFRRRIFAEKKTIIALLLITNR